MITGSDSITSAIEKLSGGNPGAMRVCVELVKGDPVRGLMALLDADDMGLKGPAIWIGFKDFAGGDLEKFREALRDRSPEMISVIRAEGYAAHPGGQG